MNNELKEHIEKLIKKLQEEHKAFVENCKKTGRAYYEIEFC
jgi:tRNA(Ser,Leu) C12 N-acetylase TAN1